MKGTKRQKKKGVWEVRVYVGRDPVTGKPRQISKTVRGGARDADAVIRDLIDKQVPARSDGIGVTVSQLLDKWLDECSRLDLSPTTIRTYTSQIDKTIRPRLGAVQLTRLTAKNLDDLYAAMKAQGSSPKTIRNYHAIMSSALHQAERWGWVRSNVADLAKPPSVTPRRVKAPSVDVVRSVIQEAEKRDPRLATMMMLGALTGMRRGELCALRWTDIDLTLGQIEVSRSVVVVEKGVAEKGTKTDRSRTVSLDEVGVALLRQHEARVAAWAQEAGVEVPSDAFVFSPELDGSVPYRPDTVTSLFIRVRDAVGAPNVRLHDLRHFTATQLIAANMDIRTVAGRLGHSDPSMTLRVYSHVLEERDKAAAAIMGQVLGPTASKELPQGDLTPA